MPEPINLKFIAASLTSKLISESATVEVVGRKVQVCCKYRW